VCSKQSPLCTIGTKGYRPSIVSEVHINGRYMRITCDHRWSLYSRLVYLTISRPHALTPRSSVVVTQLYILIAPLFTYTDGWKPESSLSAPGMEPGLPACTHEPTCVGAVNAANVPHLVLFCTQLRTECSAHYSVTFVMIDYKRFCILRLYGAIL